MYKLHNENCNLYFKLIPFYAHLKKFIFIYMYQPAYVTYKYVILLSVDLI